MAMLFVADYNLIRDSAFTISTSGDTAQQLEFKLDFGVGSTQPSIVAFVLSAQSGNLGPTLSIKVNGTEQRSLKLPDGAFVTGLQTVIGPRHLQHGVNTIEFSIAGGTGTLEVSDVVLHYQREM
ncbi:MAG: hypothetical protein U0822_04770 [Anaerolineae bacterium]